MYSLSLWLTILRGNINAWEEDLLHSSVRNKVLFRKDGFILFSDFLMLLVIRLSVFPPHFIPYRYIYPAIINYIPHSHLKTHPVFTSFIQTLPYHPIILLKLPTYLWLSTDKNA
jgi:hypothetical protein